MRLVVFAYPSLSIARAVSPLTACHLRTTRVASRIASSQREVAPFLRGLLSL